MINKIIIIFLLFLITISILNCTRKDELTRLEYELITALISNFQHVAKEYIQIPDDTRVLFMLQHIAHIKASIPSSFVYAMVLDHEGKIIAHSELGKDGFLQGTKINDDATKIALLYRDINTPLIMELDWKNGRKVIDISLPIVEDSDSETFRGIVRMAILKR
jgi:hypothetical protein